jgi:hypothetical protein
MALALSALPSAGGRAQEETEEPASEAPPIARSHDWRAPGYAAAVGGRLFDAACVPLTPSGFARDARLDGGLAHPLDPRLRYGPRADP